MIEKSNPLLQRHSQVESESPMLTLKREEERQRNKIAVLERLHGKTHPLVLDEIYRLLSLLFDCSKYKAQEELARPTFLALRQNGNIEEASEMLACLADIYLNQGNHGKAEEVAKKAIDMGTPSGNDSVLRAKCTLAYIMAERGEYENAEQFLSQVLDIKTKQPIHQSTQSWAEAPMALISRVFRLRGRLIEAEDWAVSASRLADVHNPHRALLSHQYMEYAEVLFYQWKLVEARTITNQALAKCRSEHGEENMVTANWMWCHGNISTRLGAWKEAESCLLASISTTKKLLGPVCPAQSLQLFSLFPLYAEQLSWRRASEIVRKCRGARRFSAWDTYFPLIMEAEVLDALGNHEEAYNTAWEAFQYLETREPLETPRNNTVMVKILRNLGRFKESRELGIRTLAMSDEIFGTLHPQTLQCKVELAKTYMASRESAVAIKMMSECVELFASHAGVGPDHYLTQRSRDTLHEWLVEHPADASSFPPLDIPSTEDFAML